MDDELEMDRRPGGGSPDAAISVEVLSQFNGWLHGTDKNGIADIEFTSLLDAARWVSETGMMKRCRFRDPLSMMSGPVVVQMIVTLTMQEVMERGCQLCRRVGHPLDEPCLP